MSSTFRIPGKVVTGWGCLEALGTVAAGLGGKALVVTGRSAMRKAGTTDRALTALASAAVPAALFDACEPEPGVATVDAAREAAHREAVDVVIGLGGGSAMDVAKVAAGLWNESAATAAFLRGRKVTSAGLPFVAVPATSGTGSEATINGVISDRDAGVKASIRDERFMARVAMVDPELTVSCPPEVTANAGLDALSQAIESYASVHATPITEALSAGAAAELAASVPAAVRNPVDRTARTRAAAGSLMAGMALGNARLGVIHGIVHPLGVRYDIPHGLACGVLLPAALAYNREAMGAKYGVLADIFGEDPVAFTRRLLDEVGMPANFKGFGVRGEDLGLIADASLPSGSLKANPRKVSRQDVIEMLRRVC